MHINLGRRAFEEICKCTQAYHVRFKGLCNSGDSFRSSHCMGGLLDANNSRRISVHLHQLLMLGTLCSFPIRFPA